VEAMMIYSHASVHGVVWTRRNVGIVVSIVKRGNFREEIGWKAISSSKHFICIHLASNPRRSIETPEKAINTLRDAAH
jgi:hypothetical protein